MDQPGSRPTIELTSRQEKGWWLRTRRPDDAVSMEFCIEGHAADEGAVRGPFRAILANHEGRMAVVQIFLDGVIGGYLIDVDTADGESRVISPANRQLDRGLGTTSAGYFAVASIQAATDEG